MDKQIKNTVTKLTLWPAEIDCNCHLDKCGTDRCCTVRNILKQIAMSALLLSLSAKIDHYHRRFSYEAAALAETHRNLAATCYMIKIDRNRGSWPDDARCNHNFLAEESESTFGGRFWFSAKESELTNHYLLVLATTILKKFSL